MIVIRDKNLEKQIKDLAKLNKVSVMVIIKLGIDRL